MGLKFHYCDPSVHVVVCDTEMEAETCAAVFGHILETLANHHRIALRNPVTVSRIAAFDPHDTIHWTVSCRFHIVDGEPGIMKVMP